MTRDVQDCLVPRAAEYARVFLQPWREIQMKHRGVIGNEDSGFKIARTKAPERTLCELQVLLNEQAKKKIKPLRPHETVNQGKRKF